MSRLFACRFCREIFSEGEAERCPVCGVRLEPLHRLPPSHDVLVENPAPTESPINDEHQRLAWHHVGHGRGPLAALALLGLGTFLLPWVAQELPYEASMSGLDLARRAGWLWGGAVGWFILLPLVLSRRSVAEMRGVRAVATVFASLTGLEVLTMLAFPPRGTARVPLEWTWDFGLLASGLVSLAGAAVALRFGGRVQRQRRVSRSRSTPRVPDTYTQTPAGKTLH